MVQITGRLSERLYRVLLPETKKAVTALDTWAALGTLAGMVRTENQDRLLGGEFTSIDGRVFRMIAISDGMGGLRHGQEAAALTLSSFLWYLTSFNGPMRERLIKAAHFANSQVEKDLKGESGATLSAVVVMDKSHVLTINVGDSRIYGYDDDGGLTQLSTDDTLAGLANQGIVVDSHHNANALLQHIGMGDGLEPHVEELYSDQVYNFFILTTDGVHWVGNKLISLIAENAADHIQLTRRLLSLAEMTGAHDNASLATISAGSWSADSSSTHGDTIDMEIWTPQARTILMSDRHSSLPPIGAPVDVPKGLASQTPVGSAFSEPATGPTAQAGEVSPPTKADEYRFVDGSKPLPAPRTPSKRARKSSKGKGVKNEQDRSPVGRQELFIEFESRNSDND